MTRYEQEVAVMDAERIERYDEAVSVRVSSVLKERLEGLAQKNGMSLSEYCRIVLIVHYLDIYDDDEIGRMAVSLKIHPRSY